jgi:hypothetical protein
MVALGNGAYATGFKAQSKIERRQAGTLLRFAAVSGTHGANHFLLRRAGANLQLLNTDTGALLRNVALERTSAVSIAGADGHINNTLTLDFSGGSLAVPGGISYAGGRGGYNVLALRGGHFAHEREVAHTPHAGLMVLDDTTVHYAQIAPINDTISATNYTLNATAAAETINVVNGPILSGVQTTQVNSSGSTFELVNFAHKTNVTINGNGGGDTFNLNSTLAGVGLSTLAVDGTVGVSSTFNVLAFPAAVAVAVVGGGPDSANIGGGSAQSITAAISISDPTNFIAVNVDDSADASSSRFVSLNSNGSTDTISGLTQSTVTGNVGDLASITLSGGSVGNTFIVGSVTGPSGLAMPVTLNTGPGVDSTFVQNVATGSSVAIHGENGNDGVAVSNAGSLQGLFGPVSVDNAAGFTSMVIDDSNDVTAQVATLTSDGTTDTISGVAPSNITAKVSDLNNFTLDGGSAGNTVMLEGLAAQGAVTLNSGTGADTVNVKSISSGGPIDINGQSGNDTVNLGSAGSVQNLAGGVTSVTNSATTRLTINDASDPTARAVSVGATSVTGLAPIPINYTSTVSTLRIDGGGPSDTFAVTPSATTPYEIVGGGPASATPPGNTLNMNLAGASSAALSGTPSAVGAQGQWTFANRGSVSFSHMQSLNPTALSVGDAATTVGGSGSSSLLFPVSLLAPSAQPVSATYATADGTATAAAGAYQPASGTVFFPAGATNETVLVNALGTPTVHPPQTFVLALIEPVNALLAGATATGTITDSFLPTPPITPSPAVITLATVPSPATTTPVLSGLTQAHTIWREGKAQATLSRSARRRSAVGTSFAFSLNQSASVTLAFNQSAPGRNSHGRCVAQTNKNRKGRACSRAVTKGTLQMAAHAGMNRILFQGRFSRSGTLKPGRYTLVVAATNAAGQRSRSSTLTFTIVR